ncbi:S-methyl-5-thioribose-1-phosphate isomerase [Planctomycetota bacterium]
MKIATALRWVGDTDGHLELVDQRRLPIEHVTMDCRDVPSLYEAIQTLTVRGAPAIGVSAAYGVVLAFQTIKTSSVADALAALQKQADHLATARPTAVNLFWALDRMMIRARTFVEHHPQADMTALHAALLTEAHAICTEDQEMCRNMGRHGAPFIKEGSGVLTHCNAGALATAGQGTALSVFYEAWKSGTRFTVYADETRPLLQGARLTAWELQQAGIETHLICDNMAGWLMKQGKIQAVVTGADRIAANGDAANKIGTYAVSVLAARHGIPFYITAPSSTFDLSLASGDLIEIEQRSAQEVTHLAGVATAPEGIGTENPAFDVVDAQDIAAIFTERGVIEQPNLEKIAAHFI